MNKLDTKDAVEIMLSEKKKADVKLEKAYDSYCLFPNEKDQTDWDTYSALSTALDMAISALQAQELSETQNALDTISRQAAIDAVRKCSVKEVTPAFMLVDKAEVMTELMMLPSAQLELATDCISKQSAIDAITDENIIRNMDSVVDSEMHRVKRSVHRIIASIPSAQPEPQWIPCSERLPEENVPVLLGVRFKDDFKFFVSARIDYNYWSGLGREIKGELRWMPLPEPYRAERRTDE